MPWEKDKFAEGTTDAHNIALMQTEEASQYIRAVAAVYLNEVEDFETFKKRASDVMYFAQLGVEDVAFENFPEEEFNIRDVWV